MAPHTNQPPQAVQRSQRPLIRTRMPSGETFNMNVSGSDDDDAPAAQPTTANTQSTTPIIQRDLGINDAEIRSEGRNYAPDIHYFYEITLRRSAKSASGLFCS